MGPQSLELMVQSCARTPCEPPCSKDRSAPQEVASTHWVTLEWFCCMGVNSCSFSAQNPLIVGTEASVLAVAKGLTWPHSQPLSPCPSSAANLSLLGLECARCLCAFCSWTWNAVPSISQFSPYFLQILMHPHVIFSGHLSWLVSLLASSFPNFSFPSFLPYSQHYHYLNTLYILPT